MKNIKNLDDDTKKKLMIVLGAVCIILILLFYFINNRGVNYSKIKVDKSKNIVYTLNSKVDKDLFAKEVPHLNLNFKICNDINNEIDEYVSDLYDEEFATISYNYEINGDVLSFLVKMIDYSEDYGPKPYFKSYNINLKTKKLVTDTELLDLFDYGYSDVEISIANGFNKYYKEILKEGYQEEEECDYECFLEFREVENYLDDVVFYVSHGKLYAFKPFSFYSVKGEEEYFTEEHFRFLIEKQES